MSSGLGFVLAVVALAAVAIAIGLRVWGCSWSESVRLVGGALIGLVAGYALVLLVLAAGAPGPVR